MGGQWAFWVCKEYTGLVYVIMSPSRDQCQWLLQLAILLNQRSSLVQVEEEAFTFGSKGPRFDPHWCMWSLHMYVTLAQYTVSGPRILWATFSIGINPHSSIDFNRTAQIYTTWESSQNIISWNRFSKVHLKLHMQDIHFSGKNEQLPTTQVG